MDAIDPSITDQELFQVPPSPDSSHKNNSIASHDRSDDIPNVFRLNEFVADHPSDQHSQHHEHQHVDNENNEDGSTAAAALNMIHYGFEGDIETEDPSHSQPHAHAESLNHHNHSQVNEAIQLTNAASHHNPNSFNGISIPSPPPHTYISPHRSPHHSHTASLQSHSIPSNATRKKDIVTVVPYNPKEKPKRLGRPRRHGLSNQLNLPENNSMQNVNEAMVSKFRFDLLPIEGPGSRGGKLGSRRSPRGRIISSNRMNLGLGPIDDSLDIKPEAGTDTASNRRRTRQAVGGTKSPSYIDEKIIEDDLVKEIVEAETKKQMIENHTQTSNAATANTDNFESAKTTPISASQIQSSINFSKEKANSISKAVLEDNDPKKRKLNGKKTVNGNTSVFDSKPSRTTVRNSKSKVVRSLPGPILSLNYTLYDDNFVYSKEKDSASKEKLAFGYPILVSPHAQDIMKIISYLNKFKDVIFGRDVYYIGPHDFELGLSLTRYNQEKSISGKNIDESGKAGETAEETPEEVLEGSTSEENEGLINYKEKQDDSLYDSAYVSPLMNLLFCKLLSLVLNKKKEVSTTSQKSAISELKSSALTLGLPSEWTDTSNVLTNGVGINDGDDLPPVDPKNPEILGNDSFTHNEVPGVLYNPFRDPEFEVGGLKALTPINRLILLRTLTQWSLATSEALKAYINDNFNHQDIGGERSTYYVARTVLKGYKNAEEASKEAELKIDKKMSNKKGESKEDPEIAKYVDPTSDPLAHNLRWRVDEMFVGDIGAHVGRFYLCRMADANGGGLSSLKKMQSTFSNFRELKDIPSSFKLYVEDVHQMLVEEFVNNGIEFDNAGEEVKDAQLEKSPCNWYEVAGNAAELKDFVNFLTARLEKVPPKLYKQSLNLLNFLATIEPLISNQESAIVGAKTERTTRKRDVNYNELSLSKAAGPETYNEGNSDDEEEEYLEDPIEVDVDVDDDEDYQE